MKNKLFKKVFTALALSICALNLSTADITATETAELPSSYDAREYGYITEKKIQYGGTCWAFAGTAAAEASLIKSGLADSSIDLSEYHSAYYTYTSFDDPLDNADDVYGVTDDVYTILNYGGWPAYLGDQFAKWSGPVTEDMMPYSNMEYLRDEYPLPAKDLSSECLFHLKKMVYGSEDDIKEMILKYGAVTAAYWVGNASYSNYSDYEYKTYHIPNVERSNHAVCIIGWDDNYPKENFNYQPENNGAWLVKNHDGSNQKYMYLSYETYIDGIVAFEFESADLLENNYQYDACGSNGTGNDYRVDGVTAETYINIFSAKRSTETLEKLEAVMLDVAKGYKHYIQIYVNPVIKDGQMVDYEYKGSKMEYTFTESGMHKMELSESIYLNDGDTFGIEYTTDDDTVYIIDGKGVEGGTDSIKAGESYVGQRKGGEFSYVDLVTYGKGGNLAIKGFTNSTDIPLSGDVTIDTTQKSLNINEAFKINATVDVPEGALGGISYVSSDPSVATVDSSGNVIANAPGQAVITVRAMYGSGVQECIVDVAANPVTTISMNESLNLNIGDSYQFAPVVNEDASNKEIVFFYEGIAGMSSVVDGMNIISSDGNTIANVDESGYISGVNAGTFVVVAKATDGSGIEARCTVTVGTPTWNPNPVVPDIGTTPTVPITPTVAATQSVSLGITKNVLAVGEQAQITATTVPASAVNNLEYTVSNPMVVSLNGNMVTALRAGAATITATAADSGVYGTVTVTVKTAIPAKTKTNTSVAVGTEFTSGSLKYEVTSANTATVTGAKKKSVTSVTIPATIKYKKTTFKVTAIDKKAFYGYKKLKSVTIGKNVESIGKNAFYGCKKLQTVTIKTKVLDNVGKNAFKGIKAKAKITVPKSRYSAYKKLLKNAGLGKNAVWKKK